MMSVQNCNGNETNEDTTEVKVKDDKSPSVAAIVAQDQPQPEELQFEAVSDILKILSKPNSPIDPLIQSGVLPVLVQGLSCDTNPILQLEAGWAFAEIVSGTSQQTRAVVGAGAVPHFVTLLTSPNFDLAEEAVLALGHIMRTGSDLRDYVLSLGVATPLLHLVQSDIPLTFNSSVAWTLGNICRSKNPPPPDQNLRDFLLLLNSLVSQNDIDALEVAVGTLGTVANYGNEYIQMVIDSGVLLKVVSLLSHPDFKVRTAGMSAVGNIVTGTDDQIQAVLDCDALPHFHHLLDHSSEQEEICNEALWALSSVTAGKSAGIGAVIEADLVPLIISHIEKGVVQNKKDAAELLRFMITSGLKDQISYIVSIGVIPPLCALLACKDTEIIESVLEAVEDILDKISSTPSSSEEVEDVCCQIEECGGLDLIESLQAHENLEIYNLAHAILQNYFSDDTDEKGANLGPEVGGTFQSDANGPQNQPASTSN